MGTDEKAKFSLMFRTLRKLGFNYSEKAYGQVTFLDIVKRVFKTYHDTFLMNCIMNSWLLSPFLPRKIRPWVLKRIGCHVGKGCFIGEDVKIDKGHSDMITIEDHVSIAGGTSLLCHQRDFSDYYVGSEYMNLDYLIKPIVLKKGCLIGMESFVLPGVTVGEGAIVGAGSLVTKDIPAWTVATGRPAKVIRLIPHKTDSNSY
jgi:acetyltransferase-like isoleucine patch superfamily enzyme